MRRADRCSAHLVGERDNCVALAFCLNQIIPYYEGALRAAW